MILYLSLYIYFAGLSFLDYVKVSKINRFLFVYAGCIFSFLIIWLLASLKWKTGTDWDSYYDTFYYFSDVYAKLYEPGFGAFVSVIRDHTSNYTVYLTIFSFLCLSLKFNFFLKYHKETIFTVLLLFLCYYFADIFAVRQNLAVSITLFSTRFIIDRKPILFALMVGIASTIHFTSIFYLLAYFIYWSKITNKSFYIFVVFCVLFGISGIGEKLLELSLQIIGVNGRIGEKISGYLKANDDSSDAGSKSLLLYFLGMIKRCIFIPIFGFIKDKLKNDVPKIQGYFNLYMVGNMIYFLFAKDLTVFSRASVPFLFFEIFLVGYTIMYFKKSKPMLIAVFTIMLIVAFSRFNALINSYYKLYVPYYSIFDDHIDRVIE